ncbi:short-subunit dehydrogenase [Roseovarius halotolerans]|uniref:Putative oxidoreductase n=1 Tax=Roseovarius halotolerans TaxID=505353 RepID=A0A1X6YA22_9RHOB|nr:SDR family NAD(P)-dependent oxidoreductase [Roseovarius halotolerans]RKT35021.1 short-subunit dehydrogenase [Roseovarius halotolerans]SLN15023.1 putative oxidoreductase [Roseovarius halotolerans]
MSTIAGKTFWLIGASEGLGRELAVLLDAAGARLVLSARSAERLESLAATLDDARVLPLDVTDLAAVRDAAADIGPLDGLIYNAGAYEPMPATRWDSDAALKVCDVNFTGAMRVLGEIVPRFVETRAGDITLVGSLAGYRGLPSAIAYGASKAALISLAETMRHDLRNSGVTVRIVNPGFIKTRLTSKNDFHMPMLMDPKEAAKRVLSAMQRRRFRTDFPAPFSWFIRALVYLPDLVIYRGR